ncbi:histidinol dehydrogenase [Acidovorax sp. BLS4]|uniref:histidinol dehydrogenase n=1 Tax=Acidovorax sp. BLS4 TaxID=3273430 RepID=UPI00355BFD91
MLLAQAEHGSGHERVWLVTTSAKILKSVQTEIAKQLPKLSRRDLVRRVLDHNVWLVQVPSLADCVELANEIAPEHCEVIVRFWNSDGNSDGITDYDYLTVQVQLI